MAEWNCFCLLARRAYQDRGGRVEEHTITLVICSGSALMRRMWLCTVKRREELAAQNHRK